MIGTVEEIARFLFTLDKEKQYEIKEVKQKRSLDSNAYLWVLCKKIADKINQTKEDVYRQAIKQVGTFEVVPIKKECADRWIEVWESKGKGFICEDIGKSKLEGYTNIFSYYGSSTYNQQEMSILLDYIVEEAKEMGIETLTTSELERMKSLWQSQ